MNNNNLYTTAIRIQAYLCIPPFNKNQLNVRQPFKTITRLFCHSSHTKTFLGAGVICTVTSWYSFIGLSLQSLKRLL